jgi:hypothetical protein
MATLLPSSKLPQGWDNLPIIVLQGILIHLPHRDVQVHCQSSERIEQFVCTNEFWQEKVRLDFKDSPKPVVYIIKYEKPYFNYLASRVRYLVARIDAVFLNMAGFILRMAHPNPDYYYRYYRDPLKYLQAAHSYRENELTDKLIKREAEIQKKELDQLSKEDKKNLIISALLKDPQVQNLGGLQKEADFYSLKLAEHLKETEPDYFKLILLEDDENNPKYPDLKEWGDQLYSSPRERPDMGEKLAKILFEREDYESGNIFIYRSTRYDCYYSFFLLKDRALSQYRFTWQIMRLDLSVSPIRVAPHGLLPWAFFDFVAEWGLNQTAITWLYNVLPQVQAIKSSRIR